MILFASCRDLGSLKLYWTVLDQRKLNNVVILNLMTVWSMLSYLLNHLLNFSLHFLKLWFYFPLINILLYIIFNSFCYYRDILSTVTDKYGVDLSQCQVVLLSQPDILPDLSHQAVEFANQSILILSPTRRTACNETVSTGSFTVYHIQ